MGTKTYLQVYVLSATGGKCIVLISLSGPRSGCLLPSFPGTPVHGRHGREEPQSHFGGTSPGQPHGLGQAVSGSIHRGVHSRKGATGGVWVGTADERDPGDHCSTGGPVPEFILATIHSPLEGHPKKNLAPTSSMSALNTKLGSWV